MGFVTRNVRCLYRAVSLKTAGSEVAKYNLDFVWDKGGSQPADDYTFLYGNGTANHHLGTDLWVHQGIISAVKRVEFISDIMTYIKLRGLWCDIALNVHDQTEDKNDNTEDNFNDGLEHVLDQFPKYHKEILLGDFKAKVRNNRE